MVSRGGLDRGERERNIQSRLKNLPLPIPPDRSIDSSSCNSADEVYLYRATFLPILRSRQFCSTLLRTMYYYVIRII